MTAVLHESARWVLDQKELPDFWLNLAALVRDEYPLPLDSKTDVHSTIESLATLYTTECARIELLEAEYGRNREISIPGEVFDRYLTYRSTPLVRAKALE